jgi:hypothetical protein
MCSALRIEYQELDNVTKLTYSFIKNKIRIVVFDFDQTILSVHTGGIKVKPEMHRFFAARFSKDALQLLTRSLDMGFCVAIATFSSDYNTVKGILSIILDNTLGKKRRKELLSRIYIVLRRRHLPFYDFSQISKDKNKMLQNIRNHFSNMNKKIIAKSQVILIDDDRNNIIAARKEGYQTIWVQKSFKQTSRGQGRGGLDLSTAEGELCRGNKLSHTPQCLLSLQ